MNKTARRIAILAALILSMVGLAFAPAALASQSVQSTPADAGSAATETIHVQGLATPVGDSTSVYTMSGDLVGVWTFLTANVLYASPTFYVQSGKEKFVGCIDLDEDGCDAYDYNGELRTSYVYWASFDSNGRLIKGQCVHPITAGSGSFKGASGVIHMFDKPVGDIVRTSYRGDITLKVQTADTAASNGATFNESALAAAAGAQKVVRGC
jgi:hypothetical protein